MDITNINLGACPPQYLSVGYVGETGARPVSFDFSAWATEYGAGVLQLLLLRPGDADPYPVVLDIDGTTATWTPDATATEKTGQGQAQLVYTVGGVIVKNAIFRVLIAPSLGAAGDPPEPYEDWLERLLTIAAEAQQSAIDAAGSAEAAGTSAGAAAGSAGAAAQSALDAEAAKTGAESAEQTAQQSAALARAKAAEAAEAAQIAGENADYAQQQRIMAEAAAVDAHDDAERAAQSAEDAQAAAAVAQTAATAAGASADSAEAAADEVETKGAEQITAIDQAGTTQIAAVDAAGAVQVQAIEDKGEEVIASIPSDYSELSSDVVGLKSALHHPQYGLAQKAGLLRDTAEGAIASFVPDASLENLLGLTVDIEPVQDLHGYDHPWPGGGGANIYDGEYEPGYYDVSDGSKGASTIWSRSKNPIPCKASTTYRFIFSNQASSAGLGYVLYYDSSDNYLSSYTQINSSAYDTTGQTMTTPANCAYMKFYNRIIWFTQVQVCIELSTITGFYPYSNICPISGWTGVEVQRAGVNLCDADKIVVGKFVRAGNASDSSPLGAENDNPSWSCSDYIKVAPSTQYTTVVPFYAGAASAGLVYFDKNKNALSGTPTIYQNGTVYTFTTPAGCSFVRFSWSNSNGNDAQLAVGSASSYAPYAGTTIPITFPTEAGTVYGGTLDVTNGVLTVTYAEYVFSGGEIWKASSTPNRFFINDFNSRLPYPMAAQTMVANDKQNVFSSIFGTFAYVNADGVGYIVSNSNSRQLVVNTTAESTIADINSIMTGSQLVYELATPIVIDLDPVAVSTIAGQLNNLWADTGNSHVEFAADIKTYIDSKIAAAVAALS